MRVIDFNINVRRVCRDEKLKVDSSRETVERRIDWDIFSTKQKHPSE